MRELLDEIRLRSERRGSYLHGERHWRAVGLAGAPLVADVPGADALVVCLFALFHDAMRENDGADPFHGARSGQLARELNTRRSFATPQRLELVVEACERHTDGEVTDDPTLGVCWDADRLNLWRVETVPEARYLSTPPARLPETIERAAALHGSHHTWEGVFVGFGL